MAFVNKSYTCLIGNKVLLMHASDGIALPTGHDAASVPHEADDSWHSQKPSGTPAAGPIPIGAPSRSPVAPVSENNRFTNKSKWTLPEQYLTLFAHVACCTEAKAQDFMIFTVLGLQ